MITNLGLFFIILFIFVIFIIDFKEKSDLTLALWIPLIWMMSSGSRFLGYWFNPETGSKIRITGLPSIGYLVSSTKEIGDPITRTVLLILIVCGLFILYRRKIDWTQILKNNRWIIILFLYLGISIFWSDFKGVSFKRWIRAIGDVVMVLIVLTEHDPLEAIKRMVRRFAYVIIPLSIICIIYFPSIGQDEGTWVGVTLHKNSLGAEACVCALFFLWNIVTMGQKNKLPIDVVMLFMSLYLLFFGKFYSATAIAIFFVGICIYTGISLLKSKPEYIGRYVFSTALIFMLFLPVSYHYMLAKVSDLTGRDTTTFTGRTTLWKDVLEISSRHPIIGAGYGSFWAEDYDSRLYKKASKRGQSHNGYIDVYADVGLIGLLLLLVVIFFTYKSIIRTFVFNFEYGRFRMILLTMILIQNITEANFLKGNRFSWFLFILIAVVVSVVSIADKKLTASGHQ